jgi:DNA polymerase-3 subunit beta
VAVKSSVCTNSSRTAFAVSTEESRPILNGVLGKCGRSCFAWWPPTDTACSHGVSGRDRKRLDRGLHRAAAALEQVGASSRRRKKSKSEGRKPLAFRSPIASVSTRLIEGPYPNYDQVIPRDNDRFAVVDRSSLVSALRRMAVVASDQTHRVKLSFNTALLRFTVQTPDVGEGQDEIPVQYTGDSLDIGFNSSYLLEILRYMPTDEVRFTFKTAERAATVLPESWAGPGKYVCLVMPLRLVD